MMSGVSSSSSRCIRSRSAELALLQPLQLQAVGGAGERQRLDRGVEVAMLLAQPFDLLADRLPLLFAQPPCAMSRRPSPRRAPTMHADRVARKRG